MSDAAILNEKPISNRPTTRIERAGLTAKVRRAVDLMVWDALPFDEAAQKVGLTSQAMRYALAKPPVVAYLKREMQVLRTSEGPASIKRIKTIRDAAENKPALDAAMWFVTEDAAQQRGSAANATPGVTIRIVNVVQPGQSVERQPVTTPMIEHDATVPVELAGGDRGEKP